MGVSLNQSVLIDTLNATTVADVDALLAKLPINNDYVFDKRDPSKGWKPGQLHFVPVGFDMGNAGRIKLGVEADNRIAERVVNMIEAVIELERRRELQRTPSALPPKDPRDAVARYFRIPRLDQIPELNDDKESWRKARNEAKKIRLRVVGQRGGRALIFEDDGIGQAPERLHATILSLGGDNKIKEPYLIGMWGQGGSSAFASSQYTWIVSRRAPDLADGSDAIGWTLVREVEPPDERRSFYAYLAATPGGEVPSFDASLGARVSFVHGTRIGHIGFDMGTLDPIKLYQAMNHILPNPVLPFQISTRKELKWDVCWGIGYLLTKKRVSAKADLDKLFENIPVSAKGDSR